MTDCTIGVVTIAGGRRRHLARQMESIARQTHPPDRYVIVDMGGPPISTITAAPATIVRNEGRAGRLELARSRNVGWRAADTDVVVFLDVDCIAQPTLVADYAERLDGRCGIHSGPVGYLPDGDVGRSWSGAALEAVASYHDGRPYPGQPLHRTHRYELFWSLSFAIDRAAWERIGGFDERFVGYGGEDTDFARTASANGVELWFGGSAGAFHQFHPTQSPPVQHLGDICRNASIYFDKWGEWPMQGWLRAFAAQGLVHWDPAGGSIRVR
jgi:N-acetylglucosaminyl-diphospho-decaprenol L-rhamnosyltransferase